MRRLATVLLAAVLALAAVFLPLVEAAFLNGHGPRVAESGLGLIPNHLYSAPFEDLKLKPGAK